MILQSTLAAKLCFDEGRGDRYEAMSLLCEAFHVLKGRPGVRPFEPVKLHGWFKKRAASTHELTAALFVLSVWDPTGPWPKFKFQESFGGWDRLNRAAFVGWAAEPWWP